ncbi:10470_t:CDS:2, partial [Gigaspora rosea]
VDLTQSMPSFWDAEIDKVDHFPKSLGLHKIISSSPAKEEYIANAKFLADKIAPMKHWLFLTLESLGNLPPILC